MNLARVKMLEEMAKEDPDDPFNIYALALELQSENPAKAKALFSELMRQHPTYVPTYYQAANVLWESGESHEAIAVARIGISHAKAAGDRKAAGELQGLLDMFE